MTKHKPRWLLAGLMCPVLRCGTTHGRSAALMDAYKRYSEFYDVTVYR